MSVLGLDVVTPESLYGYEPEIGPPAKQGESYTTERVILPDTSQFLQDNKISQSQGPLVSFPKYNNYLLDKTKFDKHTKILVPLTLLGIKPLEHGEVILKHTLPTNGAVVSYAQYKEAGSLLPDKYDESVMRRWGVDITIGSPLISVSILVPEYIEASKTTERNILFEDTPLNEDMDKWNKKVFTEPEVKMHENEAQYLRKESRMRRENSQTKRLFYKSLAGVSLNVPVKLQIWLDSNYTLFNERSNPQCVHWSTARGYYKI